MERKICVSAPAPMNEDGEYVRWVYRGKRHKESLGGSYLDLAKPPCRYMPVYMRTTEKDTDSQTKTQLPDKIQGAQSNVNFR